MERVVEKPREIKIPHGPLKLDELLIKNVNTWGNVEYNVPLRSSHNETRTGTNVAHRHIPPIPYALDNKIHDPLPARVLGRSMEMVKGTYSTTSGLYDVKPNPNKAMERADCAMNCAKTIFMTGVEKRLQSQVITQPKMLSEMKDMYRGAYRPPLAPPDVIVRAPDPEFIVDAVAAGRNEVPSIPEHAAGYQRLLDPYLTTYRMNHRVFTPEQQTSGLGAKDHITIYTESNTPRVFGFGPRFKEMWMPLQARPYHPIYDRLKFKKEYKEVAAAHNPVDNIKGVFVSETKKKFQHPFASSELASYSHGEEFDLAPFPPNPFQTNIAPFMYCSDYCHIAQGTRPSCVIEQFKRDLPPHVPCLQRCTVSDMNNPC